MLIEFRAENFRSLRQEQAITFQAAPSLNKKRSADHRARKIKGHPEKILTVLALYGPNASGKSNVLAAIHFVQRAFRESSRSWTMDAIVPRQPFAWGDAPEQPSLFELLFEVEGRLFRYGFVLDDAGVTEEWLFEERAAGREVWFEREGDGISLGSPLKDDYAFATEVLRPEALFLSVTAMFKPRSNTLMEIHRWLQGIRFIDNLTNITRRSLFGLPTATIRRMLQQDASLQEQLSLFYDLDESTGLDLLQFLKAADVGIVDVRVVNDEGNPIEPSSRREQLGPHVPPRLELKHDRDDERSWLQLGQESRGTQTLLGLAPTITRTIQQGGVLLVDELEASLHPLLTLWLVELFHDPKRNPRNAQLLFTSHNTHLIGDAHDGSPLRRDQIWFTEKTRVGTTRLYPLTDYLPSKHERVERSYLQGRYGAVPFLRTWPDTT